MLSPNLFIMVIGMNTQRVAIRRAEEGMSNAGAHDNQAPPQDNQVPPLEKVAMGDQTPVVPTPMTDGEINAILSIWPKP